MLHIIEPAAAALTAHVDTIRILADIGSGGDGTSNGLIFKYGNKIMLALAAAGVPLFGLHAWRVHADKDTAGKAKKMTDEAKNFMLYEGLVGIAWVIGSVAVSFFQGGVS